MTVDTTRVTLKQTAYNRDVRFGYGMHAAYVVAKHERGAHAALGRAGRRVINDRINAECARINADLVAMLAAR